MGEMGDELLDLDPGDSLEKGRPSFLTGLCITSWAGCGFLFITTFYSLWMSYRSLDLQGDHAVLTFLEMGCWALVAIGVGGMWNLRKWGFFVYLFAEIAPIVLGFVLMNDSGRYFSGMSVTSMLFSFSGIFSYLIPIAFCIMYGTNYKFLK